MGAGELPLHQKEPHWAYNPMGAESAPKSKRSGRNTIAPIAQAPGDIEFKFEEKKWRAREQVPPMVLRV